MTNLFKKIATSIVGMAMAIGVGVGLSNNQGKHFFSAYATPSSVTGDWSHTFTASKSNGTDVDINGLAWTISVASSSWDSTNSKWNWGGAGSITTSYYADKVSSITLGWATNSKKTCEFTVDVNGTSLESGVLGGTTSGAKSGEKLFDFSSTKPCGTITISSNSASGYGLKSISIVSGGTGEVTTHYISAMSVTSSIDPLSVTEGNAIDTSIFTVKGTKDEVANTTLLTSDFEFLGSGVKENDSFTPTSTSVYTLGDNYLCWRSKLDSSSSDSTKQVAYFPVQVNEVETAQFELITSASSLETNKRYLIGSASSGSAVFMGTQRSDNFGGTSSTAITDSKVSIAANVATYLTLGTSGDYYTFNSGSGYLYAASSSKNYLRTEESVDDNAKWTITFSGGAAVITAQGTNTHNLLRYNANNGNPIFSAYESGQSAIYLFKEVITTPAVHLSASIEITLGDTLPSLNVSTENFTDTPTFAWTSSDENVATISGTTASPIITVLAAGETTLSVTATYNSESASNSCILTVKAVPTAVQIKISGNVATSETVLSAYEGRTKVPTTNIVPENADQGYSLSVLSETVEGAFTINNHTINYVKPATGVIRFTSTAKSSVYFDLNVKCDPDTVVADTFAYSGTVSEDQYEGARFNPDGLSFSIKRVSAPTEAKNVELSEITFSPTTLTASTTSVTATHVESGQTVSIPVTVNELTTTPISSFFDGTINVDSETENAYKFKGTCICIISNNFYIQEGNYGIYVYAGNSATDGLEVGKLVLVEATVKTYNGLVETGTITSKQVLGDGTLPAGQIVNSVSAFSTLNQSIYASFNGLSINKSGTNYSSIQWSKTWSGTGTKSDGIATAYDSTGAAVTVFVSKYLSNGAAIVSALNAIGATDTFDIADGVVAVNNSVNQLSLMNAEQVIVHAQDEDLIASWADTYLYMQNDSFNGNGTGRCKSDNLYLTAKRALIALGSALVSDFQNNVGSKYTAALARYHAWAEACGDTSPFAGNDIVHANYGLGNVAKDGSVATIVVVISLISITALGGFFFLRKRKEEK